jgi:hypothetical protein
MRRHIRHIRNIGFPMRCFVACVAGNRPPHLDSNSCLNRGVERESPAVTQRERWLRMSGGRGAV